MNRMVITLEDSDKLWLVRESKIQRKSIAQIIRDAVHEYKEHFRSKQAESFDELLEATRGTWTQGDPLTYQQNIRSEWEQR